MGFEIAVCIARATFCVKPSRSRLLDQGLALLLCEFKATLPRHCGSGVKTSIQFLLRLFAHASPVTCCDSHALPFTLEAGTRCIACYSRQTAVLHVPISTSHSLLSLALSIYGQHCIAGYRTTFAPDQTSAPSGISQVYDNELRLALLLVLRNLPTHPGQRRHPSTLRRRLWAYVA